LKENGHLSYSGRSGKSFGQNDLSNSQRQHKTSEPYLPPVARQKIYSVVQQKALQKLGEDNFYLMTRMNEQEKAESSVDSAIAMSLFRRPEADRDRSSKLLLHSNSNFPN
jgi:hypothetical protein